MALTRQFVINGEAMVRVKFGAHIISGAAVVSGIDACNDAAFLANAAIFNPSILGPLSGVYGNLPILAPSFQTFDLGLAVDQIQINPKYFHRDMKVDGFGKNVPPDVMMDGVEYEVRTKLIHYDPQILDVCLSESIGADLLGGRQCQSPNVGTLMRGSKVLYNSGNHFMSLGIFSPQLYRPYRFLTCYLAERPAEIPLGTDLTEVLLNWRVLPTPVRGTFNLFSGGNIFASSGGNYVMDADSSSGAYLWDRFILT